MGIFTRKSNFFDENDFSKMNDLSAEAKVLIVNGQNLVNESRKKMKEKRCDFDMTGKFQLRDDCKAVEKQIENVWKTRGEKRAVKELQLAVTRLQTTLDSLLSYY